MAEAGERNAVDEDEIARVAEFFAAAMRRNNNTLYSGGAVRPEKFPSNGYPNWEDWKTHFGHIATANGWDDEQCRVALPTCLTSWALDEFSAMPQWYKTQQDGQPAPTLPRMLGYLDGRMSAFHDRTTGRLEFKAMVQGEKESIKDFARRLRSMCDIAFATYNAATKDEFNRDQFIEGLLNDELHDLLTREQPRTFLEAQNRALSLEAIGKNSRKRSRRHIAAVRSADEVRQTNYAGPSRQPNDGDYSRDRRHTARDEEESEEQKFPKMHNRMQAMESSLKEVQTSMSKMLSSILPKLREEPRSGAAAGAARQLFNPYPPDSRHGKPFERVNNQNRQWASWNKPRGSDCWHCGQEGHVRRNCPQYRAPLN